MLWSTIFVIFSVLAGVSSIFFLGNDNKIEEVCEEVIEEITEIEDIDLSLEEEEDSAKES